jgi:hypothetical protein
MGELHDRTLELDARIAPVASRHIDTTFEEKIRALPVA